jgi:hypothetical protein
VNYYQYKKNSGIFCREEVRFVFPNSKNELTVNRGRYFTVHSPFRDENKLVIKPYGATYNADVEILNDSKYDSNWGSIKVIKTRECRMANRSDEQSVLNSNKQNLKFKSDPVIKLTYKGNDDNGKYDIDTELAVEPEDEFGSGTKEEITVSKSTYTSKSGTYKSNYIYKDVQTRTYKLPDKTYRYILKEGAVFVSGNQTEGTYIDLGISTIPVSTKSKVNSDTKPLISLKFTLDDDMKLSKSFKKDNNYLPSCTLKTDPNNIYNYVKAKGKVSANAVTGITDSEKKQEIANSSCAKLYQCSATSDGIGNCKRAGVGTCITNRTINKIGNNDSNNCYVKSTASVSDENNYVCSINVASGVPGIYVPECPGCAKETTSDTTSDTTTDSSTGPSTSSVTTPLCQKEITDGVCLPSTGYSTLEYRTIDLDNPFPGQSGSGRYTGLNWCGYNEETETWNCNGNSNNEVVQEYILKNRGVSGSSVYNLEPMYSVTLTKDEISKIQGYNSSNDYDDFRLTCNNKGEECVSSFVSQYATKNCQNFGSCSQ